MGKEEFQAYLAQKQESIESVLDSLLPKEDEPPSLLHRAMRYSVLAPGKRIRPILCLAACQAVGGEERNALATACAFELVHTYSLIHDDLPSMDNDDFRRGRLTSHKTFGEGVAILTGDALLSLAFEVMARDKSLSDFQCRQVINELAKASGTGGLVGGQQVDLASQGKSVTAKILEYIHSHKTGSLITAAVRCGAIVGNANTSKLATLAKYGAKIGLAFQIKDDILDIVGKKEKLGKSTGQDERVQKATYPGRWGLEKSQQMLTEVISQALKSLKSFGTEAEPLRQIARFIAERDK